MRDRKLPLDDPEIQARAGVESCCDQQRSIGHASIARISEQRRCAHGSLEERRRIVLPDPESSAHRPPRTLAGRAGAPAAPVALEKRAPGLGAPSRPRHRLTGPKPSGGRGHCCSAINRTVRRRGGGGRAHRVGAAEPTPTPGPGGGRIGGATCRPAAVRKLGKSRNKSSCFSGICCTIRGGREFLLRSFWSIAPRARLPRPQPKSSLFDPGGWTHLKYSGWPICFFYQVSLT